MTDENIVKKVCKELGLTYKQLGEAIGVSEQGLRNAVSTDKISLQIQKSIELLYEIDKLKKQNKNFQALKETIKNIIKE